MNIEQIKQRDARLVEPGFISGIGIFTRSEIEFISDDFNPDGYKYGEFNLLNEGEGRLLEDGVSTMDEAIIRRFERLESDVDKSSYPW